MHVLSTLIAVTSFLSGSPNLPGKYDWSLDRKEIMAGGCAAIIFEQPKRELPRDLVLEINGRPEMELESSARWIEIDGRTIFLVWSNFKEADKVSEMPLTVRQRPLFDAPGKVELAIRSGTNRFGSGTVSVIPTTREAEPALAHLYPLFERGKPPPPETIAWPLAFGDPWETVGAGHDIPISKLQETLAIVSKHPDWKEIAPAIVHHRELQQQARSILRNRARDGKPVATPAQEQDIYRIANQIRQPKLTSLFAQALQKKGDQLVTNLERGAYGLKLNLSARPAQSGTDSQPAPNEQETIKIVVPPGK